MRALRGFSLIELMVAISIVAILAAMANPSFQEMLARMRVRSTAEAFNQGLQLARSEAIKRNERIQFNIVGTTGWAVCPSTTTACLAGATIKDKPALESSQAVTIAVTSCIGGTPTKITFTGLGRQYADAGGAYNNPDGSVQFCSLAFSSPATQKTYSVMITPVGFVKMCDPSLSVGSAGAC